MPNTSKILLHICCAPCLMGTLLTLPEYLAAEDEITGFDLFWSNGNIHLYKEYEARYNALAAFAEEENLTLICGGEYGLREFVRNVAEDIDNRCAYCYNSRLEAAATYAAANKYAAFTSTLLVSPHQNREKITETGVASGDLHGVRFLPWDFRKTFRQGQNLARKRGIYMQKYCGCIFSEESRYKKALPRP